MGRKKKFIDRKAEGTHTFNLIHRSQHDPRAADDTLSPYVLQEVTPANLKGKAYEPLSSSSASAENGDDLALSSDPRESIKHRNATLGIFFNEDDDYDYSQHVKESGTDPTALVITADDEYMHKLQKKKAKASAAASAVEHMLPSETETKESVVFRSKPEAALPIGWDPDVVAALDEDFDFSSETNQLTDDFMELAMSDQLPEQLQSEHVDDGQFEDAFDDSDDEDAKRPYNGPLNYESDDTVTEGSDHEDEGMSDAVWRRIGHGPAHQDASDAADSDEQWEGSDGGVSATRSRFTEYSMTSSVLTRTKLQEKQDEHFESMYAQYDEDKIGALDEEEDVIGGQRDVTEFQGILDEFLEAHGDERGIYFGRPSEEVASKVKELVLVQETGAKGASAAAPDAEGDVGDADDDTILQSVPYKDKRDREWDCESILSTRSTLYNHPTVIEERRRPRSRKTTVTSDKEGCKSANKEHNRQSDHEGSDGNDYEADDDEEGAEIVYAPNERAKDETAEERRARKQLVKAERRQRRQEKKSLKTAFKEERKRQLKASQGGQQASAKAL